MFKCETIRCGRLRCGFIISLATNGAKIQTSPRVFFQIRDFFTRRSGRKITVGANPTENSTMRFFVKKKPKNEKKPDKMDVKKKSRKTENSRPQSTWEQNVRVVVLLMYPQYPIQYMYARETIFVTVYRLFFLYV